MIIEKCADELDRASQLQEHENEQALIRMRAADQPQKHPDFDGVNCLMCDIELPLLRVERGRIRCTVCESAVEHQNKQRRK